MNNFERDDLEMRSYRNMLNLDISQTDNIVIMSTE